MAGNAKLTEIKLRTAKAGEKSYKLADGGGLYVLVATDGTRYWRYNYRFHGAYRTMSFGIYPEVSAKAAREQHQDARLKLAAGVDPMADRKLQKLTAREEAERDFETIARQMWADQRAAGRSKGYVDSVLEKLEKDVFPWIGKRPISQIQDPEILAILNRVEQRAAETARRLRTICGQVFRYAMARGHAKHDPTASMRGAIITRKGKHFAAITSPDEFGKLLRAMRGYSGELVTRCLLQLSPLVFQRPSELRQARWSEFDLVGNAWGTPMWEIPAQRVDAEGDTKITRTGWESHLVPLSRQAVGILEALRPLTAHTGLVFKSQRVSEQPLSDGAVRAALRRLGFAGKMTAHGFRASARTLAAERLRIDERILELQISHKVSDALGRAYNRTQFLDERVAFMQLWADYLDKLVAGPANPLELVKAA